MSIPHFYQDHLKNEDSGTLGMVASILGTSPFQQI